MCGPWNLSRTIGWAGAATADCLLQRPPFAAVRTELLPSCPRSLLLQAETLWQKCAAVQKKAMGFCWKPSFVCLPALLAISKHLHKVDVSVPLIQCSGWHSSSPAVSRAQRECKCCQCSGLFSFSGSDARLSQWTLLFKGDAQMFPLCGGRDLFKGASLFLWHFHSWEADPVSAE